MKFLPLVFDQVLQEKGKARLVTFDDLEFWIAFSISHVVEEENIIYVADWWVDEHGMESYVDEDLEALEELP